MGARDLRGPGVVIFQFEEVLADGPAELHTGISALEVRVTGGQAVLYSATGPAGGILAYDLSATGPQLIDQESFGPATGPAGAARLEWIDMGGQMQLVTLGHHQSTALSFDIGADGSLTADGTLTAADGFADAVVAMESVSLGVLDLVYTGHWDSTGFIACTMDAGGTLTPIGQIGGGAAQGADLAAIEAITLAGQTYLVTASVSGDAVTSYRLDAAGMPVEITAIGAADGLGIDAPSALVPVSMGGVQYLVLAASGSNSLSVLRLEPGGGMVPVDHVIDGLETRFQSVTVLEAVTVGDRVFLIAGGADDGLSLITLLPGGRLLHLAQVADSAETALMNVTALALHVENGVIEVYASSESEAGITRFSVDPGALNPALYGTAAGEALTGGAGDDTLAGGAGDDIVIDGAGSDRLRGGAGADIFVFTADGETDRVLDFDPLTDRLDLSALGWIRSLAQLDIQTTANGATITYGDEVIILNSADGTALTATDLAPAILFELDHMPVDNVTVEDLPDPDQIILGGTGDDTLTGGSGNDTLAGGDGANVIDGELGIDTLDFSTATGRAFADIQIDQRGAGFLAFYDVGQPQGDTYAGLENITGGAFADNLRGDGGANHLQGGGVSDRLYGRGGDDILEGGLGADALYGNLGADTMTGGTQAGRRDRFIYFDIAESGVGAGNRDVITDFVPGEDRIEISRFDADITIGGKQGFSFIGDAGFSGTAGELGYVQVGGMTIVQADVDGDGLADFEIELTGLLTLTAADFLI